MATEDGFFIAANFAILALGLVAILLGIAGWKSRWGKSGVVVAGFLLLPLLTYLIAGLVEVRMHWWRDFGGWPSIEQLTPGATASEMGFVDIAEHPGGPWMAKLPQGEVKALEGQWKIVRVEQGKGEASPLPVSQGHIDFNKVDRFFFQGRQLEAFSLRGKEYTNTKFLGFQIHGDTTPAAIDLFTATREKPRLAALGIYQISGDLLTLRMRWVPRETSNPSRPASLTDKPTVNDVRLTLKRYWPPADEIAVRGCWDIVRETDDGKIISQEPGFDRICWFYENSAIDINNVHLLQNVISGRYIMESEASPTKKITISRNGGTDLVGIYKFEGQQLWIAYHAGGPRPEKFESTPGSGITLMVLETSKPRTTNRTSGPSAVGFSAEEMKVADHPGGPWIIRLPSGVALELAAVGDGKKEGVWWRPDGTPSIHPEGYPGAGDPGQGLRGFLTREFVMHVHDLPSESISAGNWRFDPVIGGEGALAGVQLDGRFCFSRQTKVPGTSSGMDYHGDWSSCQAFRTRTNARGIFQDEGFENTSVRGVRMRYKLVQSPASAVPRVPDEKAIQ